MFLHFESSLQEIEIKSQLKIATHNSRYIFDFNSHRKLEALSRRTLVVANQRWGGRRASWRGWGARTLRANGLLHASVAASANMRWCPYALWCLVSQTACLLSVEPMVPDAAWVSWRSSWTRWMKRKPWWNSRRNMLQFHTRVNVA